MPKRIEDSRELELKKLKRIRKGLKVYRMQKIEKMIQEGEFGGERCRTERGIEEIVNRIVVEKEEHVLIAGNHKTGIKLKIYHGPDKSPQKNQSDEYMNAKRPQEVQNTNKLKNKDASKIKEFVAHLEQRSKLQDKIQKLRMKKQRITKLMNYASQESIPSSSSQLNMSSESGDIDLKDKVMSQENVSGI